MAFPTKMKMPVASHNRSQHDLSAPHITTSNFMEFTVAKAMELAPGQSIDVYHEEFVRLEPLSVPTFGRAEIRNYSFFVPFRTVWKPWTDFIDDKQHINSTTAQTLTYCPTVKNYYITALLISSSCSTVVSGDGAYDVKASNGNKYLFNSFGRYVYKTLRSLGYAPVFDMRTDVSSYNVSFSAMPLLAYAKVFYDWFFPSAYSGTDSSVNVAKIFERTGTFDLSQGDMLNIFRMTSVIAYDQDYLTSAWENPTQPNDASQSSYFSIQDVNQGLDTEVSGGGGYMPSLTTSSMGSLSQYALTALKALSDYLKRNQMVGSRSIDRYLARFGVKLSSEKLMRSVLINRAVQNIQFGDVTSTASTDGATLGDFAGKGISYGDDKYTVDSNGEYGMYLAVSVIVPKVYNYQGCNRHVLHTTKLDFWTPEFDNVGTQAIASAEAYVPMEYSSTADAYSLYSSVYGYIPKYAEYKVPFASLTGDYLLPSRNVGKDAWNLFRDFSFLFNASTSGGAKEPLMHDYAVAVSSDKDQYSRIFMNTNADDDHFNIIHNFDIKSSFPGKSLYDTYEFEDEDKSNKVSVDINGTTLS